jgi:hypothetical protein
MLWHASPTECPAPGAAPQGAQDGRAHGVWSARREAVLARRRAPKVEALLPLPYHNRGLTEQSAERAEALDL